MMLPLFKLLEYLCCLVVFILLLKFSEASPVEGSGSASEATNSSSTEENFFSFNKAETLKRAFAECDSGFSWMCLRVEFVKFVERLAEQEELKIFPGVSVVKDNNAEDLKSTEIMAEVARSFPNDPSARLNGYMLKKVSNFLESHYLRFKLIDSKTIAEARSAVETGRGSKFGKKGGLEAIMAAGLMMKGMMMALGMGAVALIAGKALMTALMALTLSAVLGLKSLAHGGGKSATYEIIAKPVYTASHTHSAEGGYYGGGGHGGGHSGAYKRSLHVSVPEQLQTLQ